MSWIKEIHHDISTIQSAPHDLKKFGITIGTLLWVLCGIAFMKAWWNNSIIISVAVFGVFLFISGIFAPKILLNIHRWWMSLAVVVGSIVSRIILCIVFFSVVTLISVTARLFGKKFYIARNNKRSSYWIKRDGKTTINYERMS
jgi:hypothetical protein